MQIYESLRAARKQFVAVAGDFNDTPSSAPLRPLLQETDLRDASAHPAFDDGGFAGTFGSCTAGNKIDYLLLSPALFARVQGGGVCRKGMWPGVKPVKWATFPEIKRPEDVASDHAALWVDADL